MTSENSTTITATVPKAMKKTACKVAGELGYVSLSDFVRDVLRQRLNEAPRGGPIPAARPENPPSAIKQLEAVEP